MFFVLGKNMIWIELHLNKMLTESIEVCYSSEYSKPDTVLLFNPGDEGESGLLPIEDSSDNEFSVDSER